MITPEFFVKNFANQKEENTVQFATVDSNYNIGRPSVVYDADILAGTLSKPLPHLESYTPVASDRVMVIHGVIVGKIV